MFVMNSSTVFIINYLFEIKIKNKEKNDCHYTTFLNNFS